MDIAVSILGIKNKVKDSIEKLNDTEAEFLHIDVMDGKFVPNKTEEFKIIKNNLEKTKKLLDVHLMVNDVRDYIEKYKILNPEYITFHYEINDDINGIINLIKDNNIKAGISIKPKTDIALLLPYIDKVDLILVMTVEPGKGGQKFMPQMKDKIQELIEIRESANLYFKIEVDGGINDETITEVRNVDMAVVGSYITKSNNYKKKIHTLKEKLK